MLTERCNQPFPDMVATISLQRNGKPFVLGARLAATVNVAAKDQ